jgi:hypothetical protein
LEGVNFDLWHLGSQ